MAAGKQVVLHTETVVPHSMHLAVAVTQFLAGLRSIPEEVVAASIAEVEEADCRGLDAFVGDTVEEEPSRQSQCMGGGLVCGADER